MDGFPFSAKRGIRLARGSLAALAVTLVLAACAHHGGSAPAPVLHDARAANAASLAQLEWTPFSRPERGWESYLPFVAREIAAAPEPDSEAFARALARWQGAQGLPGTGVFTARDFARMKAREVRRRPFVRLRATGVCPAPPDEATLVSSTPAQSWRGRPLLMRRGTFQAWRAMVDAARLDVPALRDEPDALKVFSAYRSPDYDAQRCAIEKNCDGVRRAQCSAHRTGLALDLVLDGRPPVDSTADADRLRLSRSLAYRWLVNNADRFGFVNYLYEPWHWEWTGEPVKSAPAAPAPAG